MTKSLNKLIYTYAVVALTVPNVALCFSEGLNAWASLANVVLPFGVYMALMSICRKPGKIGMVALPHHLLCGFPDRVALSLRQGRHSRGYVPQPRNHQSWRGHGVARQPHSWRGECLHPLSAPAHPGRGVHTEQEGTRAVGWIQKALSSVGSRHIRGRLWLYGYVLSLLDTQHDKGEHDVTSEDHHAPQYSVLNDLYPVNVFYNLYLAVKRNNASIHYKEASARFRFGARPSHPEDSCEVYVMVIGETARAMNFSLYGYQRDTNPRLSKTRDW